MALQCCPVTTDVVAHRCDVQPQNGLCYEELSSGMTALGGSTQPVSLQVNNLDNHLYAHRPGVATAQQGVAVGLTEAMEGAIVNWASPYIISTAVAAIAVHPHAMEVYAFLNSDRIMKAVLHGGQTAASPISSTWQGTGVAGNTTEGFGSQIRAPLAPTQVAALSGWLVATTAGCIYAMDTRTSELHHWVDCNWGTPGVHTLPTGSASPQWTAPGTRVNLGDREVPRIALQLAPYGDGSIRVYFQVDGVRKLFAFDEATRSAFSVAGDDSGSYGAYTANSVVDAHSDAFGYEILGMAAHPSVTGLFLTTNAAGPLNGKAVCWLHPDPNNRETWVVRVLPKITAATVFYYQALGVSNNALYLLTNGNAVEKVPLSWTEPGPPAPGSQIRPFTPGSQLSFAAQPAFDTGVAHKSFFWSCGRRKWSIVLSNGYARIYIICWSRVHFIF